MYRQFHTATTDSHPFSPLFLCGFLFPVLLPASQSLAICLHGVSSQLFGSWLQSGGSYLKSRIILRETLLPTINPKDVGMWRCGCVYVRVKRRYKNECIYGSLYWCCSRVTARTIHIHSHADCVTSALLLPPPFFHSIICIPLYYSIHCICCSRYPNSATAITLSAALIEYRAIAAEEKPRGDSLWDRLIIAFHQSPLRLAPLQLGADRSLLFPFLLFLSFSGLSNK